MTGRQVLNLLKYRRYFVTKKEKNAYVQHSPIHNKNPKFQIQDIQILGEQTKEIYEAVLGVSTSKGLLHRSYPNFILWFVNCHIYTES